MFAVQLKNELWFCPKNGEGVSLRHAAKFMTKDAADYIAAAIDGKTVELQPTAN